MSTQSLISSSLEAPALLRDCTRLQQPANTSYFIFRIPSLLFQYQTSHRECCWLSLL